MSLLTFSVPTMKCQGCASSITNALASAQSEQGSIDQYNVDLAHKTVSIDSTLSPDTIISLIKFAGFEATLTH